MLPGNIAHIVYGLRLTLVRLMTLPSIVYFKRIGADAILFRFAMAFLLSAYCSTNGHSQNVYTRMLEKYPIRSSTPALLDIISDELKTKTGYESWLNQYTIRNGVNSDSRYQITQFLKENATIVDRINKTSLQDQQALKDISALTSRTNADAVIRSYDAVFPSGQLSRIYERATMQAIVYFQDTLYYDYLIGTQETAAHKLVQQRLNYIFTRGNHEIGDLDAPILSKLLGDPAEKHIVVLLYQSVLTAIIGFSGQL